MGILVDGNYQCSEQGIFAAGDCHTGASLVVRANVPPLLFEEYSVLGIAGYLLSAILGLWVVIDILRRGGRRK